MTIDHRSQDRLKIFRTGLGVEIFYIITGGARYGNTIS